jgi:hypothetical protein
MAKLSNTAIEILLMVESPHVRVSWYNAMSPVGMASPERGHGTKSNPRPAVIFKLLNEGLIDGREHADLTLTPAGREQVAELHADGWDLVTGVGRRPAAVKKS